jgi:hypothetical protein
MKFETQSIRNNKNILVKKLFSRFFKNSFEIGCQNDQNK